MAAKLNLNKIDLKDKNIQNTIALIGIVLIAVFFANKLFYVPMGKNIKSLHEKIAEKEKLLQETQKKADKLPELEAEYELLKGELLNVEKKLPKTNDIPELLDITTNIGRKYLIDITNFSPRNEKIEKYYIMHPVEMTITTSYHRLGAFMATMGQQERVMGFKDLSAAVGTDSDGKPVIIASFMLCAYTYNESE